MGGEGAHASYGVPTNVGVVLAAAGVRHRRACVAIGTAFTPMPLEEIAPMSLAMAAAERLRDNEGHWRPLLGDLVFHNTCDDLTGIANRPT